MVPNLCSSPHPPTSDSEINSKLADEQAYLVSRGVRPMALLSSLPGRSASVDHFIKLNQERRWDAIPFALERADMDCTMLGFAAERWVIDVLEWTYANAPQRIQHCIVGLLLGYSANAISRHDDEMFAGKPRNCTKSTAPHADSTCMA